MAIIRADIDHTVHQCGRRADSIACRATPFELSCTGIECIEVMIRRTQIDDAISDCRRVAEIITANAFRPIYSSPRGIDGIQFTVIRTDEDGSVSNRSCGFDSPSGRYSPFLLQLENSNRSNILFVGINAGMLHVVAQHHTVRNRCVVAIDSMSRC